MASESLPAEPRYVAVGRRKRAQLEASIPPAWRLSPAQIAVAKTREGCMHMPAECGILNAEELELTEKYDATALAAMIRERKVTSVAVVKAFCKRAAIASQLTNCLTEFFPSVALRRAAELDAHLSAGNPPLSALHGVPVAMKDSFNIPGQDSSLGLSTLCFSEPTPASSTLTTLLHDAGAVFYCKTTVPQGLVSLDTHTNIFGRTLNPWNGTLTSGGSTGGEGALAALKGSVLGVGTDVGGSIRVPSFCCGLVGMKPSIGRVPYKGQRTELLSDPNTARMSMKAAAGPLGRSARDMRLFFDTVTAMHPELFDPDVLPGPWDPSALKPQYTLIPWKASQEPKIRLGVVTTDGLSTPHPPVTSVLHSVARACASHSSIESVTHLNIASILAPSYRPGSILMSVDGSTRLYDLLEADDEPLSPWLIPRMRRRGARPFEEIKAANQARDDLQASILDVWRGDVGQKKRPYGNPHEIDAFIIPVAPHAGPPIDAWQSVNYTMAFNFLDLPAGVVPVRRFTNDDCATDMPPEKLPGMWDPLNRQMWELSEEEASGLNTEQKKAKERKLREKFVGGWMAVQVVVPRLEEGRLVRVMQAVEEVVRDSGLGEMHTERVLKL